jgi:chemotaxis protein CheX
MRLRIFREPGAAAPPSERMRDVVKRISRSPPKPKAVPAVAGNSLALGEMLDLNAAAPLRNALLALRGADLSVDASAVQHLGAQCAQILASAALTWAADGTALSFAAASESFGQCARLLGLHSILTPESIPA